MAKKGPIMSDDPNVESTEEEPEHIRELRNKAESAKLLQLENAGLRAGIDLTSRQGRAWANTYEGSWDDPDAMKSDFSEFFGAPETVSANQSEPAPEPQGEAPQAESEFQTGMTEDLRRNQSGAAAPPGASPSEDPYQAALRVSQEARQQGLPDEIGRQRGIHTIIGAAMNGDERARWSREHHDAWLDRAAGNYQ